MNSAKVNYAKKLEQAKNISEIFKLVKSVVRDLIGKERPGLMIGLSELDGRSGMFIGAFYPVGSNLIVINTIPLAVIQNSKPELFKSYCFHVLLHEYLHTIGILDESYNKDVTSLISEKAFGENHPITLIAKDFNRVFPEITYLTSQYRSSQDSRIRIVENIDEESTRYIG